MPLHSLLASALDGSEWLTSRSGRFILGKEPRYSSNNRRQGGSFGEEKNLLPLPGFEPPTVQPIA